MKSPNMMSTIGRRPVIAAPTAKPGESCLGNRRIDNALVAEFFHQPRKHFERRARFGDVFAHDADVRVAAHLFSQRFPDGLRESQFARMQFQA